MNVIKLALVPDEFRPHEFAVSIRIDGLSLIERIRRIEAPAWKAAGLDHRVERFIWPLAKDMLLPGRHLLGTPSTPWFPGFSDILICTCGYAACAAIGVTVRLGPQHIGWLAWRRLSSGEASSGDEYRPMIFRRAQYEAELERVSEEYHDRRRRA